MDRRETIKSLGLISTHALFPSILAAFISSGCKNDSQRKHVSDNYSPIFFSDTELKILGEVVDLILPATKTLAASVVNTHFFLDEVFGKCLNKDQQDYIKNRFSSFAEEFKKTENNESFLSEVDKKAFTGNEEFAWFRTVKQYTLVGFFTSEEGTTKASNYVPVPGDYKGDISLEESTLNYGLTAQRYYL